MFSQKKRMAEAIDRYIEEASGRGKRSFADQKRALLWFKASLGFKLLSDITSAAIIELKSKWLKGSNRHGQK